MGVWGISGLQYPEKPNGKLGYVCRIAVQQLRSLRKRTFIDILENITTSISGKHILCSVALLIMVPVLDTSYKRIHISLTMQPNSCWNIRPAAGKTFWEIGLVTAAELHATHFFAACQLDSQLYK